MCAHVAVVVVFIANGTAAFVFNISAVVTALSKLQHATNVFVYLNMVSGRYQMIVMETE